MEGVRAYFGPAVTHWKGVKLIWNKFWPFGGGESNLGSVWTLLRDVELIRDKSIHFKRVRIEFGHVYTMHTNHVEMLLDDGHTLTFPQLKIVKVR